MKFHHVGTLEDLQRKSCKPCEGGMPPLDVPTIRQYLTGLSGWAPDPEGKSISKDFVMKSFMTAVRFVDAIAALAEAEGHHPDLHLTRYRKLRVTLSTHAIGGLSENDFILAGKIELLPKELKGVSP